jgi:hypothetical protein
MTDFDFVGGGRDDAQGRQGEGGGSRQQGGGTYQQGGGTSSYGSNRRDSFNDTDSPAAEIDDVPF